MESFVYAISNGQSIKIGKANNPQQRLKELQTGSSVPLVLIKVIKCWDSAEALRLESALHRHFKNYRQHLEWYSITNVDVSEAFESAPSWEIPKSRPLHPAVVRRPKPPYKPNLAISPLLLHVADWLKNNPESVKLSSRKIAIQFTQNTGCYVSAPWVLVARRYLLESQKSSV